jgi:hypothetical protein
MNVRVVEFARSAHRQAQELLPFSVGGQLDEEQQRTLDAHLRECAACRAELQWERELKEAMSEPDVPASDVDASWAQMQRRIDAPRPGVIPRIRQSGSAWRGHVLALPRFARYGLAAQFAVIAVLALLVGARPIAPAEYRALSSGADTPRPGASLIVVFDPAIREEQLRAILRKASARIAGGPNEAGAYLLSVDGANAGAALGVLRAERGVRTAESLAPGAGS